MRFEQSNAELSITLHLDDEPADLTRDGLGADILRVAVETMKASARAEQSPSGRAWAKLRTATVGRKGHALIGVESGEMIAALDAGDTSIEPTSARWSYPKGATWDRAQGFHNGREGARFNAPMIQPARPFIGWTDTAKEYARTLIQASLHEPLLP